MSWRPAKSELVDMSLDPFLPCHAAVATDAFGPVSGPVRTPTRFQAFAGTEVLGPGAGEPVRPAHSDEVSIHERRRGYVHWYVAVGAEAVALALLIVVVGAAALTGSRVRRAWRNGLDARPPGGVS